MEVYIWDNVYEDEKLNNFYHLAYKKCEAYWTHVIVLDQFLLHMEFHETGQDLLCSTDI